jgi:hypothetical protein
MLPDQLSVALKEWAIVCDALAEGRQMMLLRKGGVRETAGEFEVEHRQFLLFPTYEHQNLKMLKESEHGRYEPNTKEPSYLKITAAGEITNIVQIAARSQIDALDTEHVWTSPLIDMRFNYRPENPLYLLIVRAYRLAQPATIANTLAYAGCKSWVPLTEAIGVSGAIPAIDKDRFEQRCRHILETIANAPV